MYYEYYFLVQPTNYLCCAVVPRIPKVYSKFNEAGGTMADTVLVRISRLSREQLLKYAAKLQNETGEHKTVDDALAFVLDLVDLADSYSSTKRIKRS